MTNAATRITSFLIIAVFLAMGNGLVLIFCSLFTILIYITNPVEDHTKILRSIVRMKWLFLSILLIYLILDNSALGFSTQLLEGFKRIFILIIMMLLISWIMDKTARDQILSGLIYLLSPLKIIGIPIESLALRIELIFTHSESVSQIVSDRKNSIMSEKKNITRIAESVGELYSDVIDHAEKESLREIVITTQNKISLDQWMLPIGLFITLLLIQLYP